MSVPCNAQTFGALLRTYRRAAGLTQEALAERSRISIRAIQLLEASGVRPRRSTALQLIDALTLQGPDRQALENLAGPASLGVSRGPRRRPAGDRRQREGRGVLALRLPEGGQPRPLVTLPRPAPTNLPQPPNALIGRERDVEEVGRLLLQGDTRLVTLTGVGGSGKTRLALEAAMSLDRASPMSVWLVELASVSDPSLVPTAVASALDVRETGGRAVLDVVLAFLSQRSALLVLDNCEHLIEASAQFAALLLAACAGLRILATSREPLQIAGERRYRVEPLAVPTADQVTAPVELARSPSVALFLARAQAVEADFELTADNAEAVAQICTRLAGIPLALELAAARVGVLSVQQIRDRLDDGFRLLIGSGRTAPTRQRTLQATLDWSYDLLTDDERAAFRRLAVFAGGCDLEAACGKDALDMLTDLIDKSLVLVDRAASTARYYLLEPVRQYARQQLDASGEAEETLARHATYYAALADRASPMLRGPEQITWMDRLETERDNLRIATRWTSEHGDADDGLRLAIAMAQDWDVRGYLSEGRPWLEAVLTASRAGDASRALRMQALIAAGALVQSQVDFSRAETLFGEALDYARDLRDVQGQVLALGWLATVYRRQGDTERALTLAEDGFRLSQQTTDEPTRAFALLHLGLAQHDHGTVPPPAPALEKSLVLFRQVGDTRSAAVTATMIGRALVTGGDADRAAPLLREAIVGLRAVGYHTFLFQALIPLASLSQARGESIRAVRWFAAAEALREMFAIDRPSQIHAVERAFLASLQDQVPPADYEAAYATGKAMSLDQVLADVEAVL
jgi:non-specific serine/threonine protein kinase